MGALAATGFSSSAAVLLKPASFCAKTRTTYSARSSKLYNKTKRKHSNNQQLACHRNTLMFQATHICLPTTPNDNTQQPDTYPVSSWLQESAPSGWQLLYALLLTSRCCTTYDVKCASAASTGARHSSAIRPGDVATTLRSRAPPGGSAAKKLLV